MLRLLLTAGVPLSSSASCSSSSLSMAHEGWLWRRTRSHPRRHRARRPPPILLLLHTLLSRLRGCHDGYEILLTGPLVRASSPPRRGRCFSTRVETLSERPPSGTRARCGGVDGVAGDGAGLMVATAGFGESAPVPARLVACRRESSNEAAGVMTANRVQKEQLASSHDTPCFHRFS